MTLSVADLEVVGDPSRKNNSGAQNTGVKVKTKLHQSTINMDNSMLAAPNAKGANKQSFRRAGNEKK